MEHDDASADSTDGQKREKLRGDFDTCSNSRHLIQQNLILIRGCEHSSSF